MRKNEERKLLVEAHEKGIKAKKPCSYLFVITKDGFRELTKFDHNFDYVYNMLLK